MTAGRATRTLLLDYGGVLSGPQGAAEAAEIAGILGVGGDALEAAYWSHRPGYDSGELDAPAYWARVAATLGVPLAAADVPLLLPPDAAGWTHLVPEAVAWAAEVARRVPTSLLSNMPHDVKAHVAPRLAGIAFRQLLFSCDIGVTKPDPAIYAEALRRLGVAPDDVVMVDDRAENVDGARRAGLRAVLYTTPGASIPAVEEALAAP